jgi:hypothetical protein
LDKFFQDVGFQIADNWTSAVLIAGAIVALGGILFISGLRDHAALGEYRVLATTLGFVVALGTVVAVPALRAEAEDACDTWSRSAAPVDELRYADHDCATLFD